MNYCKCGCGILVNNEYAKGHARRGRTNSEQHILAIRKANTGKKRINTWNKGKSYDDMYGKEKANIIKKKLSEKHIGYKWSEKSKQKLSKIKKIQCNTLEYKTQCSERMKGHIVTEEMRKKMRLANTGKTFQHSDDAKEKIRCSSKKLWSNPQHKKMISDIFVKQYIDGKRKIPNTIRGKSGKRQDLNNIFFRSSWEANFARILNKLNLKWEYEPKRFLLNDDDKIMTYLPDFKVNECYVEIKGFIMPDKSNIKKFNLFRIQYPQFKTLFIGPTEYKSLIEKYKTEVNFE